LEALDIAKYRHRFPKELSGGQQQRVAIARAMIKNPKLLLCDELTGALDTKSSRSVLKFIEKMNQQFGTTILIITHNEVIADMADVIVHIKDGKIDQYLENTEKVSAADLAL
jgi:putative ABC transport system ATP-binding protein